MSDDTPRPESLRVASNIPLRIPGSRQTLDMQSPTSSLSGLSLPFRASSVSSLFASTTPPSSRPLSRTGSISSKVETGSVFGGTTANDDTTQGQPSDNSNDPRALIRQAFAPHIVVASSQDTEDLAAEKGFPQGLWQLLRPFGDRVTGKVVVRDSVGASRVCEDFAVRFTKLGDGQNPKIESTDTSAPSAIQYQDVSGNGDSSWSGGDISAIEAVVGRHLDYAERVSNHEVQDYLNTKQRLLPDGDEASPFYMLYLRRLLSGMPLVASETFSHPVACVIAISSRNPNPIEELRRLYQEATRGPKRLPSYVNGEYLRYYVLVHDEERDDIGKSMSLFEQMKRHFGLHCHLLRLRSSRCVPTDDDSIILPGSEWMSASEEMREIELREEQDDIDETSPCIFESDATAINTFIREMVTQSVVPSMERSISAWNDQVLSKRRGISGRFMSISKKWSVFGSSSKASPFGGAGAGGSNNYDSASGFYQSDTPEATMRKLGDYAFMLRDYKLAQTVYDMLKSDFNHDKAWEYHAAANEMGALTTLVATQAMASRTRAETVDQALEMATYSYLTRCSKPYGAVRCLALSMELLKIRGGSAVDDAARWATKTLEINVLGPVGDALFKERVAACYGARRGTGSGRWGARPRKSALWHLLAADKWLSLGKYVQAVKRLVHAETLYENLPSRGGISKFAFATNFVQGLRQELLVATSGREHEVNDASVEADNEIEEVSEALNTQSHRKSLIGAVMPAMGSLETAPMHKVNEADGANTLKDDGFQ